LKGIFTSWAHLLTRRSMDSVRYMTSRKISGSKSIVSGLQDQVSLLVPSKTTTSLHLEEESTKKLS
jgi:hypothetical protein